MAQLFHPSFNTIGRWFPLAVIVILASAAWADWLWFGSSWATGAGRFVDQPVPFSHLHHVRGLGIDCRYCHTTVDTSSFAGFPPTKTCITCHSEIFRDAPMLEPVRESWRTGLPMHWNRVNNLPGYVFFDHSAHVQNGVGCSSCHGNVALMPMTAQAVSLQMAWCLDCHRQPENYLRPRSEIYNTDYKPPKDQRELGRELAKQYHILSPEMMQSCSLCHR
ncbi:MAG TPA: cytochrome c3 family protein [Tepidisphaeraceae bacterium]|jgi:hypothetical protein|nr:cytochrome c3 family protein [Tepidisphaeraceae bacterium]